MFITRIPGDDNGGLIRLQTSCGREIEGGGTVLDMDDDSATRLAGILQRAAKRARRRRLRFFFLSLRGITKGQWAILVDEALSIIRQIQEALGHTCDTQTCAMTMSA